MDLKIKILKDKAYNLMAYLSYNPQFVQKIKTIEEHHWHPDNKYWLSSNINGTLEKISKVFEYIKIYINSSLQTKNVPSSLVEDYKPAFEALRRELFSRKYSYKAVKSYLYYIKNFINLHLTLFTMTLRIFSFISRKTSSQQLLRSNKQSMPQSFITAQC